MQHEQRQRGDREPRRDDREQDGAESGEIVVSVVGLVHRSGLVTLPPGARVADALAAAGGATDGADVIGLNMAQRVADGDQIHVAAVGAPPVAGSSSSTAGSGKAPAGAFAM
mgnify:CR=1 FL=1